MSSQVWQTSLQALAAGLLGTVFLLVAGRRMVSFVRLLGLQGVLLAGATGAAALAAGEAELIWVALLVLLLKGVVLPGYLLAVVRRVNGAAHVELAVNSVWSLLLAAGFFLLAQRAAAGLAGPGPLAGALLPVALTMVKGGLFVMVARRLAFTQIAGLLTLENGIFLTALAMTRGMPLLVELGVALDVLVAAVVLGALLERMHQAFATLDVERLRTLRG